MHPGLVYTKSQGRSCARHNTKPTLPESTTQTRPGYMVKRHDMCCFTLYTPLPFPFLDPVFLSLRDNGTLDLLTLYPIPSSTKFTMHSLGAKSDTVSVPGLGTCSEYLSALLVAEMMCIPKWERSLHVLLEPKYLCLVSFVLPSLS